MTWLRSWDQRYQALLSPKSSGAKRGLAEGHIQRWQGFHIMFELILAKKSRDFNIIETGTLRNPGNWKDGQSAKLFTEFVETHGGRVRSVDIDKAACMTARASIRSEQFSVECSDSVEWLRQQTDLDQVDLFYLDSYDVKWQDDEPSAQHHLQEFCTIEPFIKSGAVVAIDDNSRFADSHRRTGKGRMIVEYLETKNVLPIYDQYQIIYQF
jgi:predicted O-methyltransferase YrrM